MWIEGNQYRINGTRLNLIGTSLNWHAQFINDKRYTYMYPDTWGSTIDLYKSVLNHNVFRLHMEPSPDWMLDVADRKGMLIVVQSAIMGWSPNYIDVPSDKQTFLSNCFSSWIPQWVSGFYRDMVVTVKVEVKSGTTTYASGTKDYTVSLGDHIAFPCTFEVPYVGGDTIGLVLTTIKGGVQRFSESRRFNVKGNTSGTSSHIVNLGEISSGIIKKVGFKHDCVALPLMQVMCLGHGGNGHIQMSIDNPGPYRIVITNILGAVVKRFNGNGPARIDFSDFEKGSGVYFVHATY